MAKQTLSEKFAKENKGIYVESFGKDQVITNERGLLKLLKLSLKGKPDVIVSSRDSFENFKKSIA